MPILRTVTSIRVSRAAVRGALVAAAVLSFCAILAAPALAGGRERDRDRDGLADRYERRHSKTDPRRWDTDRDGLSDGYEVRVSKTNPRKADTDRDGLSDGDEVRKHGTNPRKADTDGDGLGDGAEIRGGSDPRDPASPGTGTPPGGGGTPTGGGTPPGGGGTPPDITAPATAILTGTTGVQGSTTAAFTFTADEPATFQCRLDGGSFASCTSPKTYTSLADGPHTFDVRATDTAGNVDKTPASSSWTVDATAPATSITSGPSATTTSTSAQIVFAADEPDSTFQCRLDTGPWASCTSAAALTDLALGPHTFEVRATDTVGNTDATPAQASWTIEQAVPDTSITAGPSGTVFEFSATLAFTSPDPGVTFECRLNGDAWAACSSPTSYLDLLVGPQTFEVRAKSPGGVVDPTPAVRTWTVEDPGGGIS